MELLLDHYLRQLYTLESEVSKLQNQISSHQALVRMRLDTAQNELLRIDTVLLTCTIFMGFGSFVYGIFGTNLDNVDYLQPMPNTFLTVTIATTGIAVVGFSSLMLYFKRTGWFVQERKAEQHTSVEVP